MVLKVGSKVSYPFQGPCLIAPVVTKVVGGESRDFHHLIPIGDGGAELFVPCDRKPAVGIRRLLKEDEIPAVLERLKMATPAPRNWRERAADNERLFASGSALDLAEVIAALNAVPHVQRMGTDGDHALERARRLLVREIAEVTGESQDAAEARIDRALAEARPAAPAEEPRAQRRAR